MHKNRIKVFGRTADARGNMTAIVTEPGNPEDAGVEVAVLIEPSDKADVRFRFFYPGSLESPICGHAVLAAAKTIERDTFSVETGAGIYAVRKSGERIFVRLSVHEKRPVALDITLDAAWFGLSPGDIEEQGVYSAGKPKLCIAVKTLAALNAVRFDTENLKTWNAGKDFTGYVLYAQTDQGVFVRATNPLFNIDENDACAVCCAALPMAGEQPFTAYMDPPAYDSEIVIEPSREGVWVGGNVYYADPET
jgi:predicted PhzF superfamily epimerase YddE/YHI9